MNITDKRVLVIGTETPWLEAVLLQRNPRYGGKVIVSVLLIG